MNKVVLTLLLIAIIIGSVIAYTMYENNEDTTTLTIYGNVDVRQVDLGFKVPGRIEKMPFEEGDLIKSGTLVATLEKEPYGDLVKQAAATVEGTKITLQNAERVLKRRQELISDGSVSKEDLENALSSVEIYTANVNQTAAALGVAQTNYQDTEIFAPNEGIVLTRVREPGTVVKEGDPVYTLSLTSPVWIRTYITEPYLGKVYPGMPAEVFTDTHGGKSYQGRVGFISPVAEFTPKTVETTQLRTDLVYRIRVIVDQPDNGLRQGMPVTVKINLEDTSNQVHP